MTESENKITIGLVGEIGSGKDTFTRNLHEINPFLQVSQISSSELLANTLKLWALPKTTANLQQMAIALESSFGPEVISNAIYKRILDEPAQVVIFNSVRKKSNVEVIRKFGRYGTILYITADPEIRFQRRKSRSEKVGEADLTWEQFLKEDQAPTELEIPYISSQIANFRIANNGSIEEFQDNIRSFCNQFIKPQLL